MNTENTPVPLCRVEGHPSDWDDELDDVYEPQWAKNERHGRAKAVCSRCPVRLWCQGEADLWTDSGIWFGNHLEQWREDQRTLRQSRWSA